MAHQDGRSNTGTLSEAGTPSVISEASSLPIDTGRLSEYLGQISTATALVAKQATRVTRQLEDVDRSLLDLTTGLEKMQAQSENTNTVLQHILLQEERETVAISTAHRELTDLLNGSNQIAALAAQNARMAAEQLARGHIIAHQHDTTQRNAQAEAARIAQETRAAQAADIAEAVNLFRALFGEVVAAKLWVIRKMRGLFGFWGELGLPFWVMFFLICCMVGTTFYEMQGPGNSADANNRTGVSNTAGRIETILARNPGWKKLLEEPRPVLDDFSNVK